MPNQRLGRPSWDYRGRFARHLSDLVVVGLLDGAEWDVEFWPFSVEQTRRSEGQAPIWDEPADSVSFLAMQVGLVVRDRFPARSPAVHAALFAARHDEGLDLRREDVLRLILIRSDIDPDAVFAEVASGEPRHTYRHPAAHRRTVESLLELAVGWPELNELKHTTIPRPESASGEPAAGR